MEYSVRSNKFDTPDLVCTNSINTPKRNYRARIIIMPISCRDQRQGADHHLDVCDYLTIDRTELGRFLGGR